jgi:hypothetical protein
MSRELYLGPSVVLKSTPDLAACNTCRAKIISGFKSRAVSSHHVVKCEDSVGREKHHKRDA